MKTGLKDKKYDVIIKSMPVGLDRTLLRILSMHFGKENAISRNELVLNVRMHGMCADERQIREKIKQMRRQGYLICAASGEGGGYYLAADRDEFEEFLNREYRSKISDMSQTMTVMLESANRHFGKETQRRMI